MGRLKEEEKMSSLILIRKHSTVPLILALRLAQFGLSILIEAASEITIFGHLSDSMPCLTVLRITS